MPIFNFAQEVLNKKIDRMTVSVRLDEHVVGEGGLSVRDSEFHIRRLEGKCLIDVANTYNRQGMTSELAATVLADCYFQGENFDMPIGCKYAQWFVERQPVIAFHLALKIIDISESDTSFAFAVEQEVKNSATTQSL